MSVSRRSKIREHSDYIHKRPVVLTTFVLPLILPVDVPCTENFSDSSTSAIEAMSTSPVSADVDGDIAVSPIALRLLATWLQNKILNPEIKKKRN